MEVLLLGTAAAEGCPCPWCDCRVCRTARVNGGRDIRSRSGVLIDNVVKVDFGADVNMQMQREGRDLRRLTTLIFTHAHNDHFTPNELQYRESGYIPEGGLPTLHVYGNSEIVDALAQAFESPEDALLDIHAPMIPFVPLVTSDKTSLLPLPAAHAPGALLLKISRGGKTLLYGHDTGYLPEETFAALAGSPLDLILFDCTYGGLIRGGGHMGLADIERVIERLTNDGAVIPNTRLIATHFSHNGGLLHEELVDRAAPFGVEIAYDGMRVEL